MQDGTQKKVRRCLKCGRVIEDGWLCKICREQNKELTEQIFYVVYYPNKRYWVWPY